ncbi:helix-turn-helix domain-containing protein [Ruegeria atlantica]|nr:helix-turn-helix domain-containing protein [Ruegeria atlantica]
MQQILDIPKRERKSDVQHHRKADDLGTGFKIFERGRSGHGQKLRNHPAPLKQSSSDKTFTIVAMLMPVSQTESHSDQTTHMHEPNLNDSPDHETGIIANPDLPRQFVIDIDRPLVRSDVLHFEVLFDLIPDIYFYIKGITGRWITCNIASLGLLSLSQRHEIFGAREESFFPPMVAEAIRADDMNVIETQSRILNKIELIANESGLLIWVMTNKLPIVSTSRESLGLVGITRVLPESGVLPGPFERFREVISYIEDNISGSLRAPDLASKAGMSESHFRRRFKDTFGVSAQEFILRTRLQVASRMISGTSEPFSTISLRCGFADQSYFTRQFVKFFGQTPKRYRLRWRSA